VNTLVDVEAVGGSGGTGSVDGTLNSAFVALGFITHRTSAAGKGSCHQRQDQKQQPSALEQHI